MSYVENIQHPTPTQARLNREYVERRRRLNGAAQDRGVNLAHVTRGITGTNAIVLRALERAQRDQDAGQQEQEINESIEKLDQIREELIVTYSTVPIVNIDYSIEPAPWRQSVTIRQVQELFSLVYGVARLDMISDRRTLDITEPRHLCVMLCKALTIESLSKIGRMFGNRDHTTVLHSCRKMKPIEDAVRARLPADATLLQWITEAIAIYRDTPKYMLKGRGVTSHG